MKKKFLFNMLLVLFVVFGVSSSASGTILYWSDYDVGSNPFPQAMSELGLSYVTATDAGNFNTQLGAGSWDTAILLIQNEDYSAGNFPNMPTYLAGGGTAIFTDWVKDTTMGSWFGITYTGNDNQTPVILTAGFLQTGIGGTLDLNNPGWGTWSMGMALNGASAGAYFPNGDVAVAYTGNTIINGMLKDTYLNYNEGLQFAKNELTYLSGQQIPEPATMLLLGSGLLGLGLFRKKFRK